MSSAWTTVHRKCSPTQWFAAQRRVECLCARGKRTFMLPATLQVLRRTTRTNAEATRSEGRAVLRDGSIEKPMGQRDRRLELKIGKRRSWKKRRRPRRSCVHDARQRPEADGCEGRTRRCTTSWSTMEQRPGNSSEGGGRAGPPSRSRQAARTTHTTHRQKRAHLSTSKAPQCHHHGLRLASIGPWWC